MPSHSSVIVCSKRRKCEGESVPVLSSRSRCMRTVAMMHACVERKRGREGGAAAGGSKGEK